MDTHIPEGMRPMLHPHRRKLPETATSAGAIAVERDRSLGRAAGLPAKAGGRGFAMVDALRRVVGLKA